MARSATQPTGDGQDSEVPSVSQAERQDSLSECDVYDVLSNARRRYALAYLFRCQESGEWPTVRELSRHIAAREMGDPIEAVSAEDRRRVHIAMHQTHLPMLKERGVIAYGDAEKAVSLTGKAQDLEQFFETAAESSQRWGSIYVAVGGLGMVIASGVGFGIQPFTTVSASVWIAVVSVLVVCVAVVHSLSTAGDHGDVVPPVTFFDE